MKTHPIPTGHHADHTFLTQLLTAHAELSGLHRNSEPEIRQAAMRRFFQHWLRKCKRYD
jgi:hypothetical protein